MSEMKMSNSNGSIFLKNHVQGGVYLIRNKVKTLQNIQTISLKYILKSNLMMAKLNS